MKQSMFICHYGYLRIFLKGMHWIWEFELQLQQKLFCPGRSHAYSHAWILLEAFHKKGLFQDSVLIL